MNASTETILKKGYILIPKSLIEDFLKAGLGTEGYLEAWIRVLALVNYSDTEICVQGNRMICRRGETVYTYSHWEKVLGWSRYRTRHFFETLFKSGIMEAVENSAGITLLRVIDYDLWTGQKSGRHPEQPCHGGFRRLLGPLPPHHPKGQDKHSPCPERME
ncbi:hypothetical protein ACIXMT_20510 [Bacteroides fragilis]